MEGFCIYFARVVCSISQVANRINQNKNIPENTPSPLSNCTRFQMVFSLVEKECNRVAHCHNGSIHFLWVIFRQLRFRFGKGFVFVFSLMDWCFQKTAPDSLTFAFSFPFLCEPNLTSLRQGFGTSFPLKKPSIAFDSMTKMASALTSALKLLSSTLGWQRSWLEVAGLVVLYANGKPLDAWFRDMLVVA